MSTKRMTMSGMYGAALMLGLLAFSAVSVEAAELSGPGDEVSNEIIVVNDYTSLVRVYVEDSEGRLHQLGRVSPGQVNVFKAPADIWERGDFRVRVHPLDSPDLLSWWDYVRIKTKALNVEDDETVIIWLRRELAQSVVEVRKG